MNIKAWRPHDAGSERKSYWITSDDGMIGFFYNKATRDLVIKLWNQYNGVADIPKFSGLDRPYLDENKK